MPLQVKETADKKSLIFDMSALNAFVQTGKFKLESGKRCTKWQKLLPVG